MIPTVQDRNTCLCKIHENTRLEAEKLKQLRIVSHVNVREHVSSIVCDPNSVACVYGKCDVRVKCENYDRNEEVWWWTWKTKSKERESFRTRNARPLSRSHPKLKSVDVRLI